MFNRLYFPEGLAAESEPSPADFRFKFNGVLYSSIDGLFVQNLEFPTPVKQRIADTPSRHGGYSQGALYAPRHFSLDGLLKAESAAILRQRTEALMLMHGPGIHRFYVHSDRFINAEFFGESKIKYGMLSGAWINWGIDFHAADPFLYADAASTKSGLNAGGTVESNGTEPTYPTVTLTVGSTGTNGTIIVTNTTTGETFTLKPSATGVYVFDPEAETVTKSSVDVTPDMIAGVFLSVNPGSNTITVSTTASATCTALQFDWRDRFLMP